MAPIEEEGGVGKTAALRRVNKPSAKEAKSRTEELLDQLREALEGQDSNRALYLLVRELGGDPLTEEVAICDPETGRSLGFLVPAQERNELISAADFQALNGEFMPPLPATNGV